MKTSYLNLIGFAVAIIWASISYTALAQKDVRLIPADTGGSDNGIVATSIGTKYIILGTPAVPKTSPQFSRAKVTSGDRRQTSRVTAARLVTRSLSPMFPVAATPPSP